MAIRAGVPHAAAGSGDGPLDRQRWQIKAAPPAGCGNTAGSRGRKCAVHPVEHP